MSGTRFLRVAVLASVCAVSIFARDNGCGPLEAGRWGLLAGVGAAPGFFKNRGYVQRVLPGAGITGCPFDLGDDITTLSCDNVYRVLTTPQNVLLQNACRVPNFGKQFSNGVLHVTGQISYNVCSNTQYFLEAVYNRATGNKCLAIQGRNFRAPDFCGPTCDVSSCQISSNSCSSSDSCSFVGTPIDSYDVKVDGTNYQAYGGYLGARYYWNRVWCDRFSFFTGFKVGMLHRKQVCLVSHVPQIDIVAGQLFFPARDITGIAYCKSNAVSGGIQIGLDYCINDCWSVLVGVEFVTTSPLKSNRNFAITLVDPTGSPVPGFGRNFNQATNDLIAPTGCLFQIPVWAGIRWEFDWCKRACNEC